MLEPYSRTLRQWKLCVASAAAINLSLSPLDWAFSSTKSSEARVVGWLTSVSGGAEPNQRSVCDERAPGRETRGERV